MKDNTSNSSTRLTLLLVVTVVVVSLGGGDDGLEWNTLYENLAMLLESIYIVLGFDGPGWL